MSNPTRNHRTTCPLFRRELQAMAETASARADYWMRLGQEAADEGDVALINECRAYEEEMRARARALYYRARLAEF